MTLGAGVSDGATSGEAIQGSGVVLVTAENGATVQVKFSDGTDTITKTVTGTGANQAVTLLAEDIGGTVLNDGTISVTALATDAAGNISLAGAATSFTLDTTAPSAPTLTLGAGVSDGATSGEAIQGSGVVLVTAENGATVQVKFSDGTGTITKTVTGTGANQAVTLLATDIGGGTALNDGTISVTALATDAAGNAQTAPASATSFTLDAVENDTTAPSAPSLTLGAGVAGGATSGEGDTR